MEPFTPSAADIVQNNAITAHARINAINRRLDNIERQVMSLISTLTTLEKRVEQLMKIPEGK